LVQDVLDQTKRVFPMPQDLIRLMNALFLPGTEACEVAPWRPAMDVHRVRGGWLVKFELAGVRPEDMDLEVLGTRMTVRGIRRDLTPREESCCFQMEIAYSRFARTLELPCPLDQADIATEYRDGMLLVRIHTEETRP
jgi:HSP20 family protein